MSLAKTRLSRTLCPKGTLQIQFPTPSAMCRAPTQDSTPSATCLKARQPLPSLTSSSGVSASICIICTHMLELFLGCGGQLLHSTLHMCVFLGCMDGMWGSDCTKRCPACTNGGVCDDKTGECICPPGFKGPTCETGNALSTSDSGAPLGSHMTQSFIYHIKKIYVN